MGVLLLDGQGDRVLLGHAAALIGQAADAYLPGLAEGPFGFLPYPLIVCIVGGLLIGYFDKKTGARPEELTKVMAKVKQDGRYSYEGIGKLSGSRRFYRCCSAGRSDPRPDSPA